MSKKVKWELYAQRLFVLLYLYSKQYYGKIPHRSWQNVGSFSFGLPFAVNGVLQSATRSTLRCSVWRCKLKRWAQFFQCPYWMYELYLVSLALCNVPQYTISVCMLLKLKSRTCAIQAFLTRTGIKCFERSSGKQKNWLESLVRQIDRTALSKFTVIYHCWLSKCFCQNWLKSGYQFKKLPCMWTELLIQRYQSTQWQI